MAPSVGRQLGDLGPRTLPEREHEGGASLALAVLCANDRQVAAHRQRASEGAIGCHFVGTESSGLHPAVVAALEHMNRAARLRGGTNQQPVPIDDDRLAKAVAVTRTRATQALDFGPSVVGLPVHVDIPGRDPVAGLADENLVVAHRNRESKGELRVRRGRGAQQRHDRQQGESGSYAVKTRWNPVAEGGHV